MTTRIAIIALLTLSSIIATGCGGDDNGDAATASSAKRIKCEITLVLERDGEQDTPLCGFTEPVTGQTCYSNTRGSAAMAFCATARQGAAAPEDAE